MLEASARSKTLIKRAQLPVTRVEVRFALPVCKDDCPGQKDAVIALRYQKDTSAAAFPFSAAEKPACAAICGGGLTNSSMRVHC